jgi:hypothetical protein
LIVNGGRAKNTSRASRLGRGALFLVEFHRRAF